MLTRKARVLVVDDEPANLQLLLYVLQQDYIVTLVESGQKAQQLLENQLFDVVLLDMMMPGISGFEVLKWIRDQPYLLNLPVIIVSALAKSDDIAKGLRLGANDYITKPIDLAVVRARVETQATLKQLLDERQELIARLQVANLQKARLMYIASHDLKSPLSNLGLLHSLVRKFLDDDPRIDSIIARASDTTNAMIRVIHAFLDSALESDEMTEMSLQPVDTHSLLQRIIQQQRHDQSVTFQLDEIQGIVMADPDYLAQAIRQYIRYAADVSPADSTIRIWVSTPHEGYWRLNIKDAGPGIPATEQSLVFRPFQIPSIYSMSGSKQTEVGLWIVQELIHLQQGNVGYETIPQDGTLFWLELPLKSD